MSSPDVARSISAARAGADAESAAQIANPGAHLARAGNGTVRAGTQTVRAHNLSLALHQVVTAAVPVSRAGIAAATGLSRATASRLVDALVSGQLVAELPPRTPVGAGRPAAGLVVSASGPAGLGLEINVDYVAACVVDLRGRSRHREVTVGDQRGRSPEDVVATLAGLASSALSVAASQGLRVVAATVALPGLVDVAEGRLRLAPNLGWRNVDVVGLLRRQDALAGLSVGVDNEANLATMAELATGKHGRTFLHISGEVGIGSGIAVDGAIFRGSRGWSGEIGHVTVHSGGRLCSCGARGCLEQYAGQDVIVREGLGPGRDDAARAAAGGTVTAELLLREARRGNQRLIAALDEAGSALGIAVASALNMLDLDRVVLGGIYGPLAPYLVPTVEREISARLVSAEWAQVSVRASTLSAGSAVLGAGQVVVREVLANPAAWI
jgi:predicted NBD/HSP70 family sugar kinase